MDYNIMIKLTILVHLRQNGGHLEFWSFLTWIFLVFHVRHLTCLIILKSAILVQAHQNGSHFEF